MAALGLVAVRLGGYLTRPAGVYVDFSKRTSFIVDSTVPQSTQDSGKLRFAVATMVSAEETFITYRRLVQRICRDVGRNDAFIVRPSYRAVREALEQEKLDVAFVCTGTYVRSLDNGGIRLLAQPEFADGLEYRCAIIVPHTSRRKTLDDLRDATMAFTDPESNTGHYVPSAAIFDKGFKPATFFKKIVFMGTHDRAIQATAIGAVDAAAVDALIWESHVRRTPSLAKRVRIIWQSEIFGPPPIVVPSSLPDDLVEALRSSLLALDKDDEGRHILAEIGIRRFVIPRPEDYNSATRLYEKFRDEGDRP
jgi:phosphonate transport system substrate-binding protein